MTEDLVLLHHWILQTSPTLVMEHALLRFWQTTAVELGFRHRYLLEGILALAAIHKAVLLPTDSTRLLCEASARVESALMAFRELLAGPSDFANFAPAFAFGSILVIYNFGIAQVREPRDLIGEVCGLCRLLKGSKTLFLSYWPRSKESDIAPLLKFPNLMKRPLADVLELAHLEQLIDQTANEARKAIYREAIENLRIPRPPQSPEDENFVVAIVLSWAARIPDAFIELLSSHDPTALIVLAQFGHLLQRCGDHWWLRNWDKVGDISNRPCILTA